MLSLPSCVSPQHQSCCLCHLVCPLTISHAVFAILCVSSASVMLSLPSCVSVQHQVFAILCSPPPHPPTPSASVVCCLCHRVCLLSIRFLPYCVAPQHQSCCLNHTVWLLGILRSIYLPSGVSPQNRACYIR